MPIFAGRATRSDLFRHCRRTRFGARLAGWGQTRRNRLEHELATVQTVWPGPMLVDVYADLRAWCVEAGHGLGQKDHEADRWVTATALRLGIPLIAHNAIFNSIEGVDLLTRL
jgi:predicted nucleic acid-binding protein